MLETVRLRLATGNEVQALVQLAADGARGAKRAKCLLLHGNPGSRWDWRQLIPQLADFADTVAIDLPGFGGSPRSGSNPEALNLDRLTEHVLAAADALGWHEPFFILGHSHGGGVAQIAAARRPDRIAGLVLVATLGSPVQASYRLLAFPGATMLARAMGGLFGSKVLRPLGRRVLRAMMNAAYAPERVPSAHLEHQLELFAAHPEILVNMVQLALGEPTKRLLTSASKIRCPVLFLHGQQDALVSYCTAKNLHDRILNAGGHSEFQLVRGAGHMLIYFQAVEIAARIESRFRQ